ncbi:MAG: site-specific DNA-methyltransferase [Sphingobacteriales bacterium 50-39]|nr:site-specific DNA-methyltransferase [Sphingobacteriales bacterium]OJW59375.1 MAG: site-specific DNA-methyltransferase [Sphingobacteriales bacterium 50-39]
MREWINRIHEGDCLFLLPRIPDNSIDLVLCDLPYGLTQNPWDKVIDLVRLWAEYRRVLKENGVIVLTSQGKFTAELILSNVGWFKYKFIWIKSSPTNFLNAKKQPLRRHEDICVFYNGRPPYNPQMIKGRAYDKGIDSDRKSGSYGIFRAKRKRNYAGLYYPNDVLFFDEYAHYDWVYFKRAQSEGAVYHPNQKPVDLGRYLVRTFSSPGAIVLDNACGSGSFLVSAVLEHRRFIGIELNQHAFSLKTRPVDFIKICNRRVNAAYRVLAARDNQLPLFW